MGYCPGCGTLNQEANQYCTGCGKLLSSQIVVPPPPRRPDAETEIQPNDVVARFIPYRNPCAVLSYYFSIFALIPCFGLAAGPVAMLLGIIGLVYGYKHPEKRGKIHAWVGVVLGLLCIIGNIVIGFWFGDRRLFH